MEHHIERYNFGPILSDVLICVQTVSEKVQKGLFGKAKIVQITAILTPRWLLWSVVQQTLRIKNRLLNWEPVFKADTFTTPMPRSSRRRS